MKTWYRVHYLTVSITPVKVVREEGDCVVVQQSTNTHRERYFPKVHQEFRHFRTFGEAKLHFVRWQKEKIENLKDDMELAEFELDRIKKFTKPKRKDSK